jgi:2-dehydropantoate 2-reductase
MTAAPRIVVLGAGSIGCHVGLTWLCEGLDVSFIGRPAMVEALTTRGATLSEGKTRRDIAPALIRCSTTPAMLEEADIVALCVKTTADEEACRQIAAHARPGTVVVSLQNGVDNAARLAPGLTGMRIVEAMVPFNVIRPGPTEFRKASAGDLMIGRDADIEAAFASRPGIGRSIEFRDDMRAVKWSKLLLNLNNALNALSGLTLHEELSAISWRQLLATMQRECLEVMEAEGIEPARLGPLPPRFLPAFLSLPDWLFNRTGLRLQKIARDARSSMADDFAAGHKTEVDFLNGAVVDLGRRHGVPCPANETAVELVKMAECGMRRLWSASEIVDRVNQRLAGVAS